MIFVVGTGRCATVTVNQLFRECSTQSTHELGDLNTWTEARKYTAMHLLNPRYARDYLVGLIGALRGEVHVNHDFAHIISLIRELRPNSRFVWLIRDPRSCVRSMANHPNWYNMAAPWERYAVGAHWFNDMSRDEWYAMSKVGKCAWQYHWKNSLIAAYLKAVSADDKRLFQVKPPIEVTDARKLCEYVGTAKQPVKVPKANVGADAKVRDWTEQEEADYRRFINYEKPPWLTDGEVKCLNP